MRLTKKTMNNPIHKRGNLKPKQVKKHIHLKAVVFGSIKYPYTSYKLLTCVYVEIVCQNPEKSNARNLNFRRKVWTSGNPAVSYTECSSLSSSRRLFIYVKKHNGH